MLFSLTESTYSVANSFLFGSFDPLLAMVPSPQKSRLSGSTVANDNYWARSACLVCNLMNRHPLLTQSGF